MTVFSEVGGKFRNPNVSGTNQRQLFEAVALDGAVATRTLTLNLSKRYEKLVLAVDYNRSAGTELTIAARYSLDGTTFHNAVSRAIAGGAITTSVLGADTITGAASIEFTLEYDAQAIESFEFVFGGTAMDGSDTVTVEATAHRQDVY